MNRILARCHQIQARTIFAVMGLLLGGCAGGQSGSIDVRLNQLGFFPDAVKHAVVVSSAARALELIDAASGEVAYRAELKPPAVWPPSNESVRMADFSALREPGLYRLRVDGEALSITVDIRPAIYAELNIAALKAFYFNRAGATLEQAYAGRWAREAGHPDIDVMMHASAASAERRAGARLSAPRGWYDAGDFNKYVVNSGISTYALLLAYEHFPDYYRSVGTNIPESGNAVPDILDEIRWNLDWLLAMQDPNDGGVYHKLTTLNFAGATMPRDAGGQRYVVQKTTAAALNFAAVMAVAARVWGEVEPEFANRCRVAAAAAYDWALSHPDEPYRQPADVHTGEYADDELEDEFFWAAAELYLLSGDQRYIDLIERMAQPMTTPVWSDVAGLGYFSLATHRERLPAGLAGRFEMELRQHADELVERRRHSAYGIPFGAGPEDFHWGGNGTALSQSMVLIQAFMHTGSREYLDAATANLDYVLGRNATGYSFVTGYGQRTPMHIHHRVSYSDGVTDPVPGFLVGGPNVNGQDGCDYPSSYPAKSYLDDWCSYTTNEVAINWNAPLVYVSGALQALMAMGDPTSNPASP